MDIRGSSYMGGSEKSEEVFAWCEWEVGKDPSGVAEDKVPIFGLYRGEDWRVWVVGDMKENN